MPLIQTGSARFYFAHIPRTGGRSYIQAMVRSGASVNYEIGRGLRHPHPTWNETRRIHGEVGCIAVVREPVDRFLSAMRFEDRCTSEADLKKKIRSMRNPPSVQERHFLPQVDFLPPHAKIYRYESDMDELEDTLRSFGLIAPKVQVGRIMAGNNGVHLSSRSGLTKVRRWYRMDYKAVGYT